MKEDGKEEKKKMTLGRDNGTRLAKCEPFLEACCWVHGSSLCNFLCFFCRNFHNEKLQDTLVSKLPLFSRFHFFSPLVEMTGVGGASFCLNLWFLCSFCLCFGLCDF